MTLPIEPPEPMWEGSGSLEKAEDWCIMTIEQKWDDHRQRMADKAVEEQREKDEADELND